MAAFIPLALQNQWNKIRDLVLGENEMEQNIPHALALASACEHPDARWLVSVFCGVDVSDSERVRQAFLALNDVRALCFAWRLSGIDRNDDVSRLRRSAESGYAFAQALLAWQTQDEERFKLSQQAAAQGERDGFCVLGYCFREGYGCEKDREKAEKNFLIAAEMGCVSSMIALGYAFVGAQGWRWRGLAATLGDNYYFCEDFSEQVALFNLGTGNGGSVYQIGHALKGNVDVESRTIFNTGRRFDSRIGPAKQAIAFYEAQLKACEQAIHAWTQVGIRFNVVKDIRILIGKWIWDARAEAIYKVEVEKFFPVPWSDSDEWSSSEYSEWSGGDTRGYQSGGELNE